MKKVLIIGGNGFIGANLARYLSKEYKVYSFDIQNPKEKNPNVEYVEGDFFDDEILENAIQDKDISDWCKWISGTGDCKKYLE